MLLPKVNLDDFLLNWPDMGSLQLFVYFSRVVTMTQEIGEDNDHCFIWSTGPARCTPSSPLIQLLFQSTHCANWLFSWGCGPDQEPFLSDVEVDVAPSFVGHICTEVTTWWLLKEWVRGSIFVTYQQCSASLTCNSIRTSSSCIEPLPEQRRTILDAGRFLIPHCLPFRGTCN